MNTYFKKPPQRKWTQKSLNNMVKNEIDYILTNNKEICTDVNVLNRFNTGSDHRLGKAVGIDGIPMEAWKFGGGAVKERLVEILRQIWKEGYIRKDWRISIIFPLYKREDLNKAGNYRVISLLCSAYKIYAEILRNRLEEEAERLDLLPESQAGFRRGRATTDNIFVLNHIIQREKEKGSKEGKVYALFVDLKAAFDNVEREQLWRILKEEGVEANLVWRMEKIYEDSEVAINEASMQSTPLLRIDR
ncbi:rna-directed dna polymerase from mobile element jockey-like protein [Lasius niger]|uniref:Rna-directed dna polymerase from mobile element jockey-like protein n=1 Tax=Lasius niger TaxID=67767 RepID=A0A0J7N713_LASNI|nr:rna-directed dna polymerase from mobile element jockey-like protein [Lasius niger]